MSINRRDLVKLAGAGAGLALSIDPSFRRAELAGIAAAGRQTGAPLTLRNVGHLSVADLSAIAAANPGKVTFEIVPPRRELDEEREWEADPALA
jgi:hypothetical protein